MMEMIRCVIKHKIHFDYILADSWFVCAEIIKFVTSRHTKCHYLGMIKMGATKYMYKGKGFTANQLVVLFNKPKRDRKYSRMLGQPLYHCGREVRKQGRPPLFLQAWQVVQVERTHYDQQHAQLT